MPKKTDEELQAEAADDARAAREFKKAPPLPPGVRTFDPRRVRRHERSAHMLRTNRELAAKLEAAGVARKALASLIERTQTELRERTLWNLIKRSLRRLWPWGRR